MKKAERKRTSLLANLGDLNRPLRVRPVRFLGREWWAIDPEDTWPGMVMDLRRLGFESMAWEDTVLVRESDPTFEPQMDGPVTPGNLTAFSAIRPTIRIRKESYSTNDVDYSDLAYLDDEEENEDEEADVEDVEEDELEPEDLDDSEELDE